MLAYDRSSPRASSDGAVAAVGDFTRFLVVTVFRGVDLPKDVVKNGLNEASGRALCLDPVLSSDSTERFQELRSEMSTGGGGLSAYDFEYEVDVCRGEVQEGVGGVLRCLVRFWFSSFHFFIFFPVFAIIFCHLFFD